MKTALLTGLVLLAGLPAVAQQPTECEKWYGNIVPKHRLAEIDSRCPYSVKELSGLTVQVLYSDTHDIDVKPAPKPAVSPELLGLMRLDLERRGMELDRLERMRRERAQRELGYFFLNQAFRQPVYVQPLPQPDLQDRYTQYLLQEYLRKELIRQRREELLGPYE